MTALVDVVAALVEREGRWLVTRRPEGAHLAGLWEFPGGKIEPPESPAQALARELAEELAIDVEVGPLRWETSHDYPDRTVRLRFFDCRWTGGAIEHRGVAEHRWVTGAELRELPFPPADTELIRILAG